MSISVKSGGNVEGLIKTYLENPEKNKKAKTAALNTIEKQVGLVGTRIINLQRELEEGYTQMQLGHDGINQARAVDIELEIGQLKDQLSAFNIQLAKLSKYKKSQKLAGEVLRSNVSVSELQSRVELIKNARTEGIPEAAKLKQEINELLDDAEKKTNRERSGELLGKAVGKYKELAGMQSSLQNGDLKAIRVRMSLIADKRLPLSKSELKFYKKNSFASGLSKKKRIKIGLLSKRVSIAHQHFSSSPGIQKQKPFFSGSVPLDSLYVPSSERKAESDWFSEIDVSRESPRNIDPELKQKIRSRLSKHNLTKKERMRTKVSVTPWQKIRHGELSKIANRVHEIGKLQMMAMAELSRVQREYTTGKYTKQDLKQDIAVIKGLIEETEREISDLQVRAASNGSSKLNKKVEVAIAANRTLLAALREKKADLEVISATEYEQASSQLQRVRENVSRAIDNPKEAGIAMFAAYKALGDLKSYEDLSAHGNHKILSEISQMRKVAETLINSAEAEHALELSKKDNHFKLELLYASLDGIKIKENDSTIKQLTRVIANRITVAGFSEKSEGKDALIEATEIIDFLSTNQPRLWGQLRESKELKQLVSHYDNHLTFSNLQRAVVDRRRALESLAQAKLEPKKAPYHIHHAMNLLKQVKELEGATKSQNDALALVVQDLKNKIEIRGENLLVLSRHKKGIRKRILEGKVALLQRSAPTEKQSKQIKRYRQVVANEMLRAMLGYEANITKEMAKTFQSQLGDKKQKIKLSSAEDLLELVEKSPGVWQNMIEDKNFLEIFQEYRLQMSKAQILQLKTVFVQWSKYELQKDQMARGELVPNEAVKNDILAKAETNKALLIAALKELSPLVEKLEKSSGADAKQLRELKSLINHVNNFLDRSKSQNPTPSLEAAIEYAVRFRSMDDDQGIAEAVMVQAFNADDLRKPPAKVGVSNLIKELERLKDRDPLNRDQWQVMVDQAGEYRQLFEDAGGVFKDLYIGDSVNGYEVNESAQLSPEQAARVDKIADRQEKILKSIQALKFNATKFAPLQMAYPLRFESAIKQRERALAKLQALPRRT